MEKIFTKEEGKAYISAMAKEFGVDENTYLNTTAKNSYILAKSLKKGIQFVAWENGNPMAMSSKLIAAEELFDRENTDISYKGYKIMNELDFLTKIGATDTISAPMALAV